jgi:hypothetical protein
MNSAHLLEPPGLDVAKAGGSGRTRFARKGPEPALLRRSPFARRSTAPIRSGNSPRMPCGRGRRRSAQRSAHFSPLPWPPGLPRNECFRRWVGEILPARRLRFADAEIVGRRNGNAARPFFRPTASLALAAVAHCLQQFSGSAFRSQPDRGRPVDELLHLPQELTQALSPSRTCRFMVHSGPTALGPEAEVPVSAISACSRP